MSLIRQGLLASVCLCLSAWTSAAQTNLFLLPNTSSSTGTITSFRLDPFSPLSSFNAQPGASFFFMNPAGTKFYSVTRSGSETLLVLEAANPANVLKRQNLGQAEAATLTPDGRRLLIAAGGLHIIDTASDTLLNTVTNVGNTPIDIAVSKDASRAYVLSAVSNLLTAVDLNTNAVTGTGLAIPGQSTGVAVGYNGLVYVTTANRLYEVDGLSMTIRREIPLNARPGKIVFTPDGRYGLMVNQTPVTGSSVILVDLPAGIVAGTIPNFQVTLDSLVVASNNRIYSISNQTQSLYEITVSPLNINPPQFGNIGTLSNVTALVATNETPNPRFLFAVTPNSVVRLDNSSLPPQGAGAAAIPANPGALVFAAPALTGTPTQIVGYNSSQTTGVGSAYQPLITRVLSSTGQPLQGVPVTFVSDNASAQIQGATVVSNAEGYAQTTVIAPSTPGTFNVTATGGPGGPTFVFTLTTGSTTGGGGGLTGALTIVRGQGQIVREQFPIQEPFTVLLRDLAGKPAPNQTITFAIQTGSGSFNTSTVDGTPIVGASCTSNVCTVQTDADGRAAIGFIGTLVNPGSSYSQQTITATNGTATVNFIVTTILSANVGGSSAAPPFIERIKPIDSERFIVGQAGTTVNEAIKLRVIVTSGPQSGQPIPNIALRVTTGNLPSAGPTAICVGDGDVALSDASGFITCNMALGGRLGVAPLEVVIGGTINLGGSSLNVDVRPGPPSTIRIVQGNNQSGLPGARLPLAFVGEISDAFGNILPNITATWTVPVANSLTLANVVSTSDSSGRVSALGTLGSVAGTNVARVSVGNVSASFSFAVNVSITGLRIVSGDGQTAITNSVFPQPLIVQVTDDRGQPVANQNIAFTVVSGSASVSTATATTNAAGQASVNVNAGSGAGPISIRASLNALTQTFNLTTRLPGPVFTVNGVVNSASNAPGLVPCGIGTIYGSGIAAGINGVIPANLLGVGGLPLILNGVEVILDGQAAPVYAIANQDRQESVVFQTPCTLVPGSRATATVRVSGGTTTISGIQVFRAQPGIFETVPGGGARRYAAVQRPDGSWVSPTNPAVRGEILKVLLTGLGAVAPSTATNRVGVGGQAVQSPLVVGVNDQGVRVVSAEYAVGMMGVYIVTFELPSDTATGTYRNISIAAEGVNGELIFSNGSAVAAIQ